MIPVAPQSKPAKFNALVRKPGLAFLSATPNPNQAEWKSHAYWLFVKDDLYAAYGQVCAYSCHWIPGEGNRTCDHYVPKNEKPKWAYEWKNFRLACGTVNGRKGKRRDVLDPFLVQDGWFAIQFPSLLVVPRDELDAQQAKKVQTTIDALGLNDDGTCLQTRRAWLRDFCVFNLPINFLQKKAPFLSQELNRQNLLLSIAAIMQFPMPENSIQT